MLASENQVDYLSAGKHLKTAANVRAWSIPITPKTKKK